MTEPGWIAVVGWDDYQHRDAARAGKVLPWVKFPTRLIRDDAFIELSPARRGIFCTLLAEYAQNACRLRADTAQLSRRLNARVRQDDLEALELAGLIRVCASTELAWRLHDASPRASREEKERESRPKDVTGTEGERPQAEQKNGQAHLDRVLPPLKAAAIEADALERARARIGRSMP